MAWPLRKVLQMRPRACLHWVCIGGGRGIVSELEKSYDPVALHHAANKGNDEVAKLILESAGGGKEELVLVQDSKGLTALHHAAAKGNVEVAKQMLENFGEV